MARAGRNIHLFDLGPPEALSNRRSLDLPSAFSPTSNQHGPGTFFQFELKKKKETGEEK